MSVAMFDFIVSYSAKREAQLFWNNVYSLMCNGYTEDRALKALDPTGVKRAWHPRPEDFPGCFEKSE